MALIARRHLLTILLFFKVRQSLTRCRQQRRRGQHDVRGQRVRRGRQKKLLLPLYLIIRLYVLK